MQEPTKAELIAFDRNPDEVPPRAANVILQAFPVAPLIEATVLLAASKPSITSWVEVRSSGSLLASAQTDSPLSPHFLRLM